MHAATPDPFDRPPPPHPAASGAGKGSTGSHPTPVREPSLSDLLRGSSGSSRRAQASASDVAAHLASPTGPPTLNRPPEADDDFPTVITGNGKPPGTSPPLPPYIVGEVPSVAGRRLGHFELIEAIGSGGMAAVLRARDLDLDRIVALKILPPESARDAENVVRFKHEARAAALLDHENVARVYFCGEDQGLHFIAFEFVEGITLRQMIDRRGPLPAGECVRYMLQVAAGLTHAAERGVVHRDIKPSNLVVTPDGRAKIVDMGLARQLDQAINGGVTQSGVTLGTFDYISPEQALDPRRADVRSDIYSLGCAFYHALTGRPPVGEGTAAKKLHAHQYVDPLDPRELNPAIPDELAAILSRMMAKDVARRYQSPAELIGHLKALGEKLRLTAGAVEFDAAVRAVPADGRVLPAAPRLRLGWVAAVAAVAVAAVVIAASGGGSGPARAPLPWANAKPTPTGTEPPTPQPNTNPVVVPPQADGVVQVATAAELADALADATTPTVRVKLAPGVYDLVKLGKPVAFEGSRLELDGTVDSLTVVKIACYAPTIDPIPGRFTVRAGAVAIRGLRFEIASPTDTLLLEEWRGENPAITIHDAARVDLIDCVFLPSERGKWPGVACVGIGNPTGDAAVKVHVERCVFGPGGVGLKIPPATELTVDDSGFGPNAAAVLIRGPAVARPPEQDAAPLPKSTVVRIDRSSFLLDPASAVVERDAASTLDLSITAGYCVFTYSTAPPVGDGGRPGVIVRAAGDTPTGVRFAAAADRPNAYYRVDPVATTAKNYTFDDCKALKLPVADPKRVDLRQRPWDAAGDVLAPFASVEPWRAFRLRVTGPTADADLFVANTTVKVIGARFLPPSPFVGSSGGRTYPDVTWPPPDPADAAKATRKVWWPDAKPEELRAGDYTDLVHLLRDARSGDTVEIRHTGVLKIEPLVIQPRAGSGAAPGEFHLTFRPYQDHRPTLTPAPAPTEVEDLARTLFRIRDGKVTFEGLHFLVKPARPKAQDSVAAVTVVAGKGCDFHDCVFTLDQEDDKIAAAVILVEPGREMSLGPAGARPVPRVEFKNCLIRGTGCGVLVESSRAFKLDLEQCVTAVNGPVLFAKAAARDPGAAAQSAVRLTRVTALLGGPLVELHAGKIGEMRASGLVPTTVTATACLFAAVPGAGQPVVRVTGTDLDPADPNRVLEWKCGEPNRFANFEPTAAAAVVTPDAATTRDWNWTTWLAFAKEVGTPVGKVTFWNAPAGLKELADVVPDDVAVKGVEFRDFPGAKASDAGVSEKVARPEGDE